MTTSKLMWSKHCSIESSGLSILTANVVVAAKNDALTKLTLSMFCHLSYSFSLFFIWTIVCDLFLRRMNHMWTVLCCHVWKSSLLTLRTEQLRMTYAPASNASKLYRALKLCSVGIARTNILTYSILEIVCLDFPRRFIRIHSRIWFVTSIDTVKK